MLIDRPVLHCAKEPRPKLTRRPALPLVVLFSCSVLAACQGPPAPAKAGSAPPPPLAAAPSGPLSTIYRQSPSYISSAMGQFATGLALADINGDHLPDMVISNGNDVSPQPVVVFYNDPKAASAFGSRPGWYSDANEYNAGLAVGDIDKDGALDVAVSVAFGRYEYLRGGRVSIYMNRAGTLEARPSYSSDDRYITPGCALGDIDSDGDLDLAVAVMLEDAKDPSSAEPPPGHTRIYLNENGAIQKTPAWTAATANIAGDVAFADVNQDGWMDLVVAGQAVQVYYGSAPKPGVKIPLPLDPSWTTQNIYPFAYGVDVGSVGSGPGLSLAVSVSCLFTACDSRFVLHTPGAGINPVWSSTAAQYASKVLLADLTGDEILDLIAGQWGTDKHGGPLWIFQGSSSTPPLPASPTFTTTTSSVVEGLAVADIKRASVCARSYKWKATTKNSPRSVITLPERVIEQVRKVSRGGVALPPSMYAWTPAENWVSLRDPLAPGEQVEVEYDVSPIKDIAAANYQNYYPSIGNYIFFSFLDAPKCNP